MKCMACRNEINLDVAATESIDAKFRRIWCNVCGHEHVREVEAAEEDAAEEPLPLNKRPIAELRELAESAGIDHEGMKKSELVEALSAD